MNISSINASIAAATPTTQSPQVANLITSVTNSTINNVAAGSATVVTATLLASVASSATATITSVPSPPTTTTTSAATTANKLNSDWLKIKVTNPLSTDANRASSSGDDKDTKDTGLNSLKINKATPTTATNFVKHKLVSTTSTNSSGNIQIHLIQPSSIIATTTSSSGISVIQPPSTLTLTAPKNIIKSTNISSPTINSPNTTALNVAQLTKSTANPASANSSASNPASSNSNAINIPTTVNVNSRKINVGPSPTNKITLHSTPSANSTSGSSNSANSTSNTINNLVKNILSSSSSNNIATTNAAAAVTAAANIFSQMNAENGSKIISKASPPHPIITTLVTGSSSSGETNTTTTGDSVQPSHVQQVAKTTNQINLPPTTLNISSNQAQNQLPKITVLSNLGNSNSTTKTIKHAPNRVITTTNSTEAANITKTTVPISLKSSSNSSQGHLIPITSASNGQISNIVSGINLKSLSPISFLPTSSHNDAASSVSFVNSKLTNLANNRNLQNATTPPPMTTPITLTNNQPLTISTANISNYISKSATNPGNVYKTISQVHLNESEDGIISHQPTTVHNFTNSNSQTIAQLCSGLNNQYQIQQGANGTTIQPIRLIPNSQGPNHMSQQASKIYQNNVQLQQITLNPSMLTTNQQQLGSVKKASNNSNSTANTSTCSGSNIISNIPQSSSSPSASPVKPNIIKRQRRDSPNHVNLQNMTENQHQILNVQAANLYNQSLTGKHPIYELTQSSLVENNNKQTKIHLDNNQLADHQFFSLPSSSSVSSSSTHHHQIQVTNASNNPRSIVNLIADNNANQQSNSNDITKNIRKFTLNTQLNIPTSAPKDPWATTSSYASSSAATTNSNQIQINPHLISSHINNSKKPQVDMPSSSALPTSSQQQQHIQLDKTQQSNSNTATPTSRKRRKQEFKAKNPEEQLISYNTNPLSNNTALTYTVNSLSPNTNRYLNENTNINNSILGTIKHQQMSISGSSPGYYNCGNELTMADVSVYDEDADRSKKKMRSDDLDDNECLDDETVKLLSKEFSYVASNGVTWTSKKNRSKIAITKCYKTTWKPRNNHYVRYSDIKTKDKVKNPTIITQKELFDNLNEWKFHFVISQVKNLIGFENESLNVIDDIENLMQEKNIFDDYSDISIKINESIKANNQRHKHVNEQLDEAQQLIHKLFDHKDKFTKYLLVSSNEKSFNNSTNNKTSSAAISTPNSTNKSKNFSNSGSGNKKGISTRSSQMKNSSHLVKSNLNRSSTTYGSPKSSKS